ncbi:MAG: cellulose biosynthesis cyclic di-GMP-binding regulatory protein BcsB [Anaerolineae bacterium]
MKHYWIVILISLVLLSTVCPTTLSALAQAPSPTPLPLLSPADKHEFTVTLAGLGYVDEALYGPSSSANYYFNLPAHWQPLPGSYTILNMEYRAQRIAETTATPQPVLATVTVSLGDYILKSISLISSEQISMQIPLPAEVLAAFEKGRSRLTISLEVLGECYGIQQASLIVKSTSSLRLVYTNSPLTIDLALYPYPFYQRSFEPDEVRFVLPPRPTPSEMEGATAISAKLGQLTDNRMVISTTTSLEWDTLAGEKEHLIVLGKPQTNSLIPWLNANAELPVSLRLRQMELVTKGPESIVPGREITLTAAITNSSNYTLSTPQLRAVLPPKTGVVACQPKCTEEDSTAQWALPALAPGETSLVSLTLQVTQPITATNLECTFSLADKEHGPLNVNSFIMKVASAAPPFSSLLTHREEGQYFFAYGDQAIPERDGIIQEITSPWDLTKAILIVTGLTDEALQRACYALSTGTRFPGMQGTFALVRETRPAPLPISEPESVDVTFADLGYDDEIIRGIREHRVEYQFDIPPGWRLTPEAFVMLIFSHSALIDYQESSLTVLFNDTPVGSVALDENNMMEGSLQVPLPGSRVRLGQRNKLSVLVDMRLEDECYDPNVSQIWTAISRDSLLHLAHTEETFPQLDLDFYPYPFAVQPDMHDVAIVLPPLPGTVERDGALRLASGLGSAANGEMFNPAVFLGEPDNWEDLRDYHVIAIGRPSANPAIAQVNAHLPQPFIPGTDEIEQVVDNVVFRLPPGLSLGYIQEIPSPWNEERAFLAVTGTTDEGVGWAIRAFIEGDLVWQLKGNLALVRDREIHSIDTRGLTRSGKAAEAATAIPELIPMGTPSSMPPTATSTPVALATATPPSSFRLLGYERPAWLTPLVLATVLAVAVIFGIATWQARRR